MAKLKALLEDQVVPYDAAQLFAVCGGDRLKAGERLAPEA